jgi:phage-related protein
MSLTAFANLVTIYNLKGGIEARYQNSSETSLTWNGNRFQFVPFIYQGASKSRTGDNLQAALVLSTNWLSTGIAKRAVNYNWRVTVETIQANPQYTQLGPKLTEESWICASMAYDETTVELILSSGIDAVGATAPYRRLRTDQVGALPVTGSIQNR